ncbi:alanine--tRNA ligase [Patescibacteria group bacterium]|nr:alanine--tRNA ligase [Patescibacteria group bacterium]
MTSIELRKKFLNFFKDRNHTVVSSSSLVPNDSSVLLTTAGMQQFKPYYTGKVDPIRDFGSKSTVSIQKCFRTSDIEEVGDDTHLSFFEMFGNFSFGDYFKKEAIHYAYKFVVEELGIERNRIYVTIFAGDNSVSGDEESFKIWNEEIGLPKKQIKRRGRSDNWWGPTGSEGPCGPTTEIYVAKNLDDARLGNGLEIWNIVFNEYYQNKKGDFDKLEIPGIDTGMGLERLAVMTQGANNIFETDLFIPIIRQIKEVSNGLEPRIIRILADHIRSSIFLIADGVRPSNKETGYILRRFLRKVIVYGSKYDIHADLFPVVLERVAEIFGEIYPDLKNKEEILNVYYEEKGKFNKALSNGLKIFNDFVLRIKPENSIHKLQKILGIGRFQNIFHGKEAFSLYETYGLPKELIQEFCEEKGIVFDEKGFDEEYKKHQEVSRAGSEKKFGGHGLVLDTGELKAGSQEDSEKVIKLHTATHLLQQALRNVLGNDVKQMGSDINSERGRFDFSFNRKLTEEEIEKVEEEINEIINKDLPVYYKEMSIEEAKETGALYFFKEKYPNKVRVYFIGPKDGFPSTSSRPAELGEARPKGVAGRAYSVEFCGGPHVENTLKVGKFKIQKQESVGAGVRRIKFGVITA